MKRLLFFIIVITLFIIGIVLYKKQNLNQEITAKIVSENQVQQRNDDGQGKEEIELRELVEFKIPELGIKFKIQDSLADDLVYHYNGEHTATNNSGKNSGNVRNVSFTTKQLQAIDSGCAAKANPIGGMSRWEGKAENYDWFKNRSGDPQTFVQLDSFVIEYFSPQAICFSKQNSEIKSNMQVLDDALKKYTNGLFQSKEFFQSIEISK